MTYHKVLPSTQMGSMTIGIDLLALINTDTGWEHHVLYQQFVFRQMILEELQLSVINFLFFKLLLSHLQSKLFCFFRPLQTKEFQTCHIVFIHQSFWSLKQHRKNIWLSPLYLGKVFELHGFQMPHQGYVR